MLGWDIHVYNPVLFVALNGQILPRWVFAVGVTRGYKSFEKHWVRHIATLGREGKYF